MHQFYFLENEVVTDKLKFGEKFYSENNPYSIDDDPPPPAYSEATDCEKPAKDSAITHQNPMPLPGMMPMAGGKVGEPGTNPPPVPQPYLGSQVWSQS